MNPTEPRGRVHPLAAAALVVSLAAAGFALYGSFLSEVHLAGSRLNEARGGSGLSVTQQSARVRGAIALAAYFLPFGLGLTAALLGGDAMRRIDRRPRQFSGSLAAVFAIMIGGLAAVVSGCMILAVYGWRYVPSVYTS